MIESSKQSETSSTKLRGVKLSSEEFGDLFSSISATAFRWESLPVYRVNQEKEQFQSFLDGNPIPLTTDSDRAWRVGLSKSRDEGKQRSRVRLIPDPITPYFRFELQWGYIYNWEAGEHVRLISQQQLRDEGLDTNPLLARDFWIFDDHTVVEMHYDSTGKYLGVARIDGVDITLYVELARQLTAASIELPVFLANERNSSMSSFDQA